MTPGHQNAVRTIVRTYRYFQYFHSNQIIEHISTALVQNFSPDNPGLIHYPPEVSLARLSSGGCQRTSLMLSQGWPSSMSPYGVTRPQWVKSWSCIVLHKVERVYYMFVAWQVQIVMCDQIRINTKWIYDYYFNNNIYYDTTRSLYNFTCWQGNE